MWRGVGRVRQNGQQKWGKRGETNTVNIKGEREDKEQRVTTQ